MIVDAARLDAGGVSHLAQGGGRIALLPEQPRRFGKNLLARGIRSGRGG